jgi:2-polyprenyl-3-methyl-5-hydroxy-6-metoxy-1,4-benzoquinol methylase
MPISPQLQLSSSKIRHKTAQTRNFFWKLYSGNRIERIQKGLQMHRLIKKVSKLLYQSGLLTKAKSQKENWQEDAQKFEFNFHKGSLFRQSQEFIEETDRLFSCFGFYPSQYEDKVILDLGAGSRLRSKYFVRAKLIALEPLADQFIKEIDWCDLNDAWRVYSQPAETYIEELERSIDFIMSINVLDHCFDFQKIIQNIYRYLKPDSIIFLSFDKHIETNKGHPLILTEKICNKIFQSADLHIEKFVYGFPSEFTNFFPGRRGYGGQDTVSLNYWLGIGK